MAISRYQSDPVAGTGKVRATARAVFRIRRAIKQGKVELTAVTLQESERLDQVAGRFYGDGRLWWVVAAASNIGWGMQVPPGTQLLVPTDLTEVMRYV